MCAVSKRLDGGELQLEWLQVKTASINYFGLETTPT